MQLNQILALQTVEAGGPGSGRHPGFGMMQENLKRLGFKPKSAQDIGHGPNAGLKTHWEHPETGHKATVSRGTMGRENHWMLKDKEGTQLEHSALPLVSGRPSSTTT